MRAKRENAEFIILMLLMLCGIVACVWFIASCTSWTNESVNCKAAFAFLDWAFGWQ